MPFLLIDKPTDWTSHDVVGYLRRQTGIRKIGHAGTLDPFATGLLIVAIERSSTKRLDEFKALPKRYETTMQLGAVSDTQDLTGVIEEHVPQGQIHLSKKQIEETLKTFIGPQEQIPPMYSAKKVDGKKLYELAREGKTIERKANHIVIDDIQLISYNEETKQISIDVRCSTGTYIRTLCHDIGQALKVAAYCQSLRRSKIGPYRVQNAHPVKEITSETWQNACFDV